MSRKGQPEKRIFRVSQCPEPEDLSFQNLDERKEKEMIKKILTVIVVVLWYGAAFAAHPLITDDTGTQGGGKFQLEVNGEYGHEEEDGVTENAMEVAAALSYGINNDIDIVLGIPYQYIRTEDSEETVDEDGLSDMSIEMKWHFYEKDGLSFALKPGALLPVGDEEKGLGNGRASYGLVFITTKEAEPLAFHFNLGYTRNEYKLEEDDEANRKDIWHVSLASELQIFEKLSAAANIGTERNPDRESNTNPAFILGGLIYSVTENFDVDFGVKAGLNKPETDCSILAGIAGRF